MSTATNLGRPTVDTLKGSRIAATERLYHRMPHITLPDNHAWHGGAAFLQAGHGCNGGRLQPAVAPRAVVAHQGERETIAALVSTRNECQFCSLAHTAVAAKATGDREMVCATIDDPGSAPVSDKLRAHQSTPG